MANAKTPRRKVAKDNPPCPPVWQYLLVMGSELIALGEAEALIFRYHGAAQLQEYDLLRAEFLITYAHELEFFSGRKIKRTLISVGKATIGLGPNHKVEELRPLAAMSDEFIELYRTMLEKLTGWEA